MKYDVTFFIYLFVYLFSMFVSLFFIINDYTEMSIHMVTSECSNDYFIAEKYETIQSFKLHFLQSIPLVQLCKSASD